MRLSDRRRSKSKSRRKLKSKLRRISKGKQIELKP